MSELEVFVLKFPGGSNEYDFYKCTDVDAMLAALPPAMTWTSEKPQKPGWYWCRKEGTQMVLNFTKQDRDSPLFEGCEWAGPLEPPQ